MKRILILLLLLAVAGGTAFYLSQKNTDSSTLPKEISDFAVKDTGSVTKIFLADKSGNTVTLERQEKGKWRLNDDLIARKDYIDVLLETLRGIKVKAAISRSAYNNILKNMAGSSTKVEIYQGGDKPSKVYFVGSSNQTHSGSYMLLEGADVPFLMHKPGFKGYLGPRYSTSENEWRSKEIFEYSENNLASVKVEYLQEPKKSFEIQHSESNELTLTSLLSGQVITQFDTAAIYAYLSSYKKIHFESFEETKSTTYIDSVSLSNPQIIYSVTDRSGKTKVVKTFVKPAKEDGTDIDGNPIDHDLDRLYALINDKQFVVIQYHVFDNLSYSLNDFLPRPGVNK